MNARSDMPMGLIRDLAAEQYHATHALSAGGLKRLRQSPLHFWSLQLDPNRKPTEPTPAMRAGTLAHCALLEPHALDARYVIVPTDAPRQPSSLQRNAKKPSLETLDAIEWWDTFASQHAHKDLIDADQLQTAKRQAAAVRALPEIASLMENGFAESSAFWIDEETGELCKCRPDWVSEAGDGVVIIDLKTTIDASPAGFPRTIANFDYHLQCAHYSDGYEKATGRMVLGFVFACVESAYPHAAAAYMLDDTSLAKARTENQRLTRLYAECKASGEWPGYDPTIQVISLPSWAS